MEMNDKLLKHVTNSFIVQFLLFFTDSLPTHLSAEIHSSILTPQAISEIKI